MDRAGVMLLTGPRRLSVTISIPITVPGMITLNHCDHGQIREVRRP